MTSRKRFTLPRYDTTKQFKDGDPKEAFKKGIAEGSREEGTSTCEPAPNQ